MNGLTNATSQDEAWCPKRQTAKWCCWLDGHSLTRLGSQKTWIFISLHRLQIRHSKILLIFGATASHWLLYFLLFFFFFYFKPDGCVEPYAWRRVYTFCMWQPTSWEFYCLIPKSPHSHTAQPISEPRQRGNYKTLCSSYRFVYIFALPDTRVLNPFEELCYMQLAAVNSYARVLNLREGAYILSSRDCFVVSQIFSVDRHVGCLKLGSKPYIVCIITKNNLIQELLTLYSIFIP